MDQAQSHGVGRAAGQRAEQGEGGVGGPTDGVPVGGGEAAADMGAEVSGFTGFPARSCSTLA